MSQQPLDLNNLAQQERYSVEVKTEDPVIRDARIKQEAIDAAFQRWRGVIVFGLVCIGIICFTVFCVYVIVSAKHSQEEKKWAMGIFTSIVSGFLGYMLGSKK